MNSELRKKIQALVNKMLPALYGPHIKFPIDPVDAIEKLGGIIQENSSIPLDVDAEIHRANDGFIIKLRDNIPVTRRRFTLAHELGHLFLHMDFLNPEGWKKAKTYHDGAFRRTEGDYSEEELQAHEFAAAFLMPEAEFFLTAKKYRNPTKHTYDIQSIADHFGVSTEAATLRGKWLRLFAW
jgi:Zn-dependent peptidase ImmA (M78 family)